MRIALFGGKFDPPHYGHLRIAQHVLVNGPEIDEIWFIPAKTHPWRSLAASASDRLNMVKLIEEPHIKASDIDINREGDTFTVDTINELLTKTKNDYFWIVGSDQLATLSKWKNYQVVSRMIPFLVIPRKNYPVNSLPDNFMLLNNQYTTTNLSSTEIRDRISQGLSITKLVPKKIANYIKENKLYV